MSLKHLALGALLTLSILTAASAEEPNREALENWPNWRGPNSDGVAPYGNPPTEWSEDSNIKWKIEVPGLGNATPIIWKNQIFILTAIETDKKAAADPKAQDKNDPQATREEDQEKEENKDAQKRSEDQPRGRRGRGGRGVGGRGGRGRGGEKPSKAYDFVVLCFDRQSGKELWKQVANETVPHEGFRAGDNSFASGSPTTDGKYLYASFGSFGVYCYDLDGKLVWERDLGNMETRNAFGEGTSPTLYRDRLIVNWDHEGQSQIFILDAKTGETKWQRERDEKTSWATPLVVEHKGRVQVIVSATNRVRSYDLETGDLVWECGGQTTNTIPSPLKIDDNVICMSGFQGSAIYSVPLDSTGDLTKDKKVAWYYDGETDYRPGTPYVPSALLYGDLLYFLKSNDAMLTCMSAHTGEVFFDKQRLQGLGRIYSSPVGAGDKVYITGRDGATLVIKHGEKFEQLATNTLNDGIDASGAIVSNELFLRGKKHLYCIAE
ncbi:MAG: PQQ-binding-like beta-propeller repeat protein [Planctomycetaceae bacterium]